MYLHCAVTRIEAKSEAFEMFMQLDVNTAIYPMSVGDRFVMALAWTLNLDGTADTGYYTQVTLFLLYRCITFFDGIFFSTREYSYLK